MGLNSGGRSVTDRKPAGKEASSLHPKHIIIYCTYCTQRLTHPVQSQQPCFFNTVLQHTVCVVLSSRLTSSHLDKISIVLKVLSWSHIVQYVHTLIYIHRWTHTEIHIYKLYAMQRKKHHKVDCIMNNRESKSEQLCPVSN